MTVCWRILWRLLLLVLLVTVTIEGVNTGLWLANQRDDLAVLAGALAVFVSFFGPLAIGIRVLPWNGGEGSDDATTDVGDCGGVDGWLFDARATRLRRDQGERERV